MLEPDGTWEPLGHLAGPAGAYPVGMKAPQHQTYVGQSLAVIAQSRGQDWIDAALDLIVAEPERVGVLLHLMSEANIEAQLREPWVMLGSDVAGYDPAEQPGNGTTGHPRALGNFTRLLGHYVRERGILSLEEAVHRLTGLPARHLRLKGRGELRPGAYANVVIFDPATVSDRATYGDAGQLSVGVRDVWVNGTRVVCGAQHTRALPGMRLYGPGALKPV